jgi:cellulose synthase/poly-beta-1,6-N-acetylglucosamine synthase-like glycosyltransferase
VVEFTQSPTIITPAQFIGSGFGIGVGPGFGSMFKAVIIISSTLILYVLPSVVDDSVVALLVSMFLYIVRFASGIYVNSIISSIEMLEVSAPGWTENPERLC